MKETIIGISEGTRYSHYEDWFSEPHIRLVKLSHQADNFNEIEKCHGVILSGGHDIDPRLYNQPDFLRYVNPQDIDPRRDEFEWNIIRHTESNGKPLLGICRGLQLVNVYFGGTLIPDIPAFGKYNHSKLANGTDRVHSVDVDVNSWLFGILGTDRGVINSAHHQGIDMPGFDLVASALSPDGIIEGLERRNGEGRSFLLLVQWHPESMSDRESRFCRNIKNSFLEAVTASI